MTDKKTSLMSIYLETSEKTMTNSNWAVVTPLSEVPLNYL